MPDSDMNKLTQEQITRIMNCETAEELMAAAKEEGVELTKEEAEVCIAKLADVELDEATLKQVAGGGLADDFGNLFKFIASIAQVLSPTVPSTGNDSFRQS